MVNPIVVLNASVVEAPNPPTLQQSGAMISQGATNLAPGQWQILTQESSLTPLLVGTEALASLSWAGGTVTATTEAAHGLLGTLWLTVAGAIPGGYNGVFLATVTGPSTFTYELDASPGGAASVPGVYSIEDLGELVAMNDTFWGMGSQVPTYVLELGAGTPAQGVAALSNFINNTSPQMFYLYLVPRTWAAEPAFLALQAQFESVTAKTYFFTTGNLQNYTGFTAAMKCMLSFIEAPETSVWPANALTSLMWADNIITATTATNHGVAASEWFQLSGAVPVGFNGYYYALEGTAGNTLVAALAVDPGTATSDGTLVASQSASPGIPSTEFSAAAAFWTVLSWNANSANLVRPLTFAFMFGTTPFPLQGNSSILAKLLAASVNYIGTGGEGGVTTSILRNGRTMDGNQFNWWYSIDWLQINSDLALANAVINGSNSLTNPLWYNQDGINTLTGVVSSTVKQGISAGLILGTLTQVALDPKTFATNVENGVYQGQAVVNAVPFATYIAANPDNYKPGIYGGFYVAFTPQTGFQQVILNLQAIQFGAGGA